MMTIALKSRSSSRRGFTLVEILVVIAIIGILSSVVMASFSIVKMHARDAKRLSDVRELSKALALYADSADAYPVSTNQIILTGSDSVSSALTSAGLITRVPLDPLYTTGSYAYTYVSNGAGTIYTLGFCLEHEVEPYAADCTNTVSP